MGNVLNDFLLFFAIGYRKNVLHLDLYMTCKPFFLITIFDFFYGRAKAQEKKNCLPSKWLNFQYLWGFRFFFLLFFLFLLSGGENWRSLIKEVFSGLFGDFKRSIDLVRGNQSLLNSNLNWNVKAQIIKKRRKENNQCIHFRGYVSTSVFKSANTEKRIRLCFKPILIKE